MVYFTKWDTCFFLDSFSTMAKLFAFGFKSELSEFAYDVLSLSRLKFEHDFQKRVNIL